MNKEQFDAAVERLREVNAVVGTLDEAIRGDAFAILRPYVESGQASSGVGQGKTAGARKRPADASDLGAFFGDVTVEKPHEAVYAIAAWWFSQYGSAPFSLEDVRTLAGQLGHTIPDRIDKTLISAKDEGKALFRKASRGKWAPTVNGELWIKEEYQVAKGTKAPPADDSS